MTTEQKIKFVSEVGGERLEGVGEDFLDIQKSVSQMVEKQYQEGEKAIEDFITGLKANIRVGNFKDVFKVHEFRSGDKHFRVDLRFRSLPLLAVAMAARKTNLKWIEGKILGCSDILMISREAYGQRKTR